MSSNNVEYITNLLSLLDAHSSNQNFGSLNDQILSSSMTSGCRPEGRKLVGNSVMVHRVSSSPFQTSEQQEQFNIFSPTRTSPPPTFPSSPPNYRANESSFSRRKLDRTASEPMSKRGGSCGSVSGDDASSNYCRYKTELCRPFEENGTCKYGDKCQFAHGRGELRSLIRHPKYKTDLCKTYHTTGFCPYGPRCHFIHNDEERLHAMNVTRTQEQQTALNERHLRSSAAGSSTPSNVDQQKIQQLLLEHRRLQQLQLFQQQQQQQIIHPTRFEFDVGQQFPNIVGGLGRFDATAADASSSSSTTGSPSLSPTSSMFNNTNNNNISTENMNIRSMPCGSTNPFLGADLIEEYMRPDNPFSPATPRAAPADQPDEAQFRRASALAVLAASVQRSSLTPNEICSLVNILCPAPETVVPRTPSPSSSSSGISSTCNSLGRTDFSDVPNNWLCGLARQ